MTPRPDLGSFADEHYLRLQPYHTWTDPNNPGRVVTQEELDWPMLIWFGNIAKLWQELEDIIRDNNLGVGWSTIVDLDRIPDKGLPYIAQYRGKTLLPGTTPDQQRERIRSTDGFDRGTGAAVEAAAKLHLLNPLRYRWSGAEHGSVSVDIDTERENLCVNPRAQVNTAGMTLGGNAGLLSTSLSRVACSWDEADFCYRVAATQPNDSSLRAIYLIISPTGTSGIPCAPGDEFTMSAFVKTVDPSTARGYRWLARWYDAAGVLIGTSLPASAEIVDEAANDLRVSFSLTGGFAAPAGAAFLHVRLELLTNTPNDVITFETTRIQIEKSPVATDYFDGGEGVTRSTEHGPSVIVNERLGDEVFEIGVVTRTEETPDPIQTFNDILEQTPPYIKLTHAVEDEWGYRSLKIAFDDYGEIKIHYPDYEGLKENDPAAPGI